MPFFLALLLLAAAEGPQIRVYPSIVMRGSGVQLTCRIPRRPENRSVTFGLDGRTSTIALDGANGPQTFFKQINDVECPNPQVAICMVTDNMGKQLLDTKSLPVAGCPDDDAQ